VIAAVGVVIPAHDEEELLPSCLAAVRLAAAPLPGLPVHVVVVADACTDQTAAVARAGGAAVLDIGARNVGGGAPPDRAA
jgi:glycosyltransferase involved in cell wall biosynthesis